MDELHRLNYLEALGVQQWLPRAPLPNAKESVFAEPLAPVTLESAEKISVEFELPDSKAVKEVQNELEPAQNNAADAVDNSAVNTVAVIKPASLDSASLQNSVEQNPPLAIKLNLEVYGRNNLYALLIEKEHSKPLGKNETTLLNNILKTLDRIAKGSLDDAAARTQSNFRETFTWPMFESPVEPDAVKGQQAMCDALNAFVNASVKRHQHSKLVILGDELAHLLDQQFLGKNTRIFTAPSLDKMLAIAEQKIETWNILLQAFKA